MQEDLGTVLNKGYGTWTRNMIIAVPFIFDLLATIILSFLAAALFVIIFVMPEISSYAIAGNVPPETYLEIIRSLLEENLLLLIGGALLLLLLLLSVGSFFEAGAIGMCHLALSSGDTSLKQMLLSGRHHVLNLVLARIMVALIIMAGIIFLVPGVLTAGKLDTLTLVTDPTSAGTILMGLGLLAWFVYALIAVLSLFFVEYALVVDDLDPISALQRSVLFFKDNKASVIGIIGIIISISLALQILGSAVSSVQFLANVWNLIYLFISVFVIRPLTTIWITRMYMARTGKTLYSFDQYLLD